ncbi:MAG: YggS family pyridoxal phosphate-dependent enzyme [Gammaproteobacteria bacterium]|nr:YggS family pyridoxal phosphate-dependent enzyme [Gammaproteobacteria bacterium]
MQRPPASVVVATGIEQVRTRLAAALARAGRPATAVTLLAVSKGQSVAAIRELAAQGQHAFGENYVQEALSKIAALGALDLSWHFIGRIQSNKTRDIAAHFSWVHGIDRLKTAARLSAQRPPSLPPLQCCIEVNLQGETQKGGVTLDALPALVAAMIELPRVQLRGLMGMPALTANEARQRAAFRQLRAALAPYAVHGLDTLSMGTSADFEAAIQEGATIVRVGTAIFGPRSKAPT